MTPEPRNTGESATENEAYLWDRSGPADPLVQKLEQELAAFRGQSGDDEVPEMPELAPVIARIRARTRFLSAAAAVVLIGVFWAVWYNTRPSWEVAALEGAPVVHKSGIGSTSRLRKGDVLTTDAASRASIAIKDVGTITVDPGSKLSMLKARKDEQRMALQVGTIHAVITAPPTIFLVDTPAGLVTDWGCKYTLTVTPAGDVLLDVTQGWVRLSEGGPEAKVPAGASCRMETANGPGSPWFTDAPKALITALANYELAPNTADLRTILGAARAKDSLTLWHLLQRVPATDRPAVYNTLAALAPPPGGVTAGDVLKLDPQALDDWWKTIPDSW